jgi:hypothetical protein
MVMIDLGHEKKSLGVISVTCVTNPWAYVSAPSQLLAAFPQVRRCVTWLIRYSPSARSV